MRVLLLTVVLLQAFLRANCVASSSSQRLRLTEPRCVPPLRTLPEVGVVHGGPPQPRPGRTSQPKWCHPYGPVVFPPIITPQWQRRRVLTRRSAVTSPHRRTFTRTHHDAVWRGDDESSEESSRESDMNAAMKGMIVFPGHVTRHVTTQPPRAQASGPRFINSKMHPWLWNRTRRTNTLAAVDLNSATATSATAIANTNAPRRDNRENNEGANRRTFTRNNMGTYRGTNIENNRGTRRGWNEGIYIGSHRGNNRGTSRGSYMGTNRRIPSVNSRGTYRYTPSGNRWIGADRSAYMGNRGRSNAKTIMWSKRR